MEARKLTRYETLAQTIETLIAEGTFLPGDRVPSVRQLSTQQQVSATTVQQAYLLLENRGLLKARDRSGFYVQVPQATPPPRPKSHYEETAELTVADLIAEVLRSANQDDIAPLGAACPSPELLPGTQLARIAGVQARTHPKAAATAYTFSPGLERLRRQLSQRALATGATISPEEILITDGCMESLNLALAAVARPGDLIAVESPSYFALLQAISARGMRVMEIPADTDAGTNLEALDEALGKHPVKAFVSIPTFHNPLGFALSEEKKRDMVALLERHGVPLIEDDIYGDLAHDHERPRPAKAYDRTGNAILCSSLSKTLGPGLRVGWIAAGRYAHEVETLKNSLTVASPGLAQLIAAEFLHSGGYERHLRKVRRAFEQQMVQTTRAVLDGFPKGTRISRPEGGFILWVELPEGTDSVRLYRRALDKRIGLIPGPVFSASGGFGNYIRLSCGYPWSSKIERAIGRLGELADKEARRA